MVKKFLAFLFLIPVLAHPLLEQGYSFKKTRTGASVYSKQHSQYQMHSVVYLTDKNEVPSHLISRLNARFRGQEPNFSLNTITCHGSQGPDYFRFIPQLKASIQVGKGPKNFSNTCFNKVKAQITKTTDTSAQISITSSRPSSVLCQDSYMISILQQTHFTTIFFEGTHKIVFQNLTSQQIWDINYNGIRVFAFCDGVFTLLEDLFMTLKMFAGGFFSNPDLPYIGSHTTQYMEKASLEFLQHSIGFNMTERHTYKVDLPAQEIKSGDVLAMKRLDGFDPVISFGSGSLASHTALALWIEQNGGKELYIVQSQAGGFWPRSGIQMNKYSKWLQWAENSSFNVIVLPLKKEVQANFDQQAAYQFFQKFEGFPYGYHNFFFGWIDTPDKNFPSIVPLQFVSIFLRIAQKVLPSIVQSWVGQALNKRLGTKGLNIAELEMEAWNQGMTLLDVMAIIEEDQWIYSDGYSFVCSSFIVGVYKAAGILGQFDIQGTEFTPKNLYELDIFDKEYQRPQACVDADPDIPYCQILGKYRIDLGSTYSIIEPYDHMNEKCPSVPPDFERTEGC